MSACGFLGEGAVDINPIVGGVKQGWVGPFETTKFEIKAKFEIKERISRGKDTYGQVFESVSIPKPLELSVDFVKDNKSTLAIALQGGPIRVAIRFEGRNKVDGIGAQVEIYEAIIASDFLANDFNSISVSGGMKTPAGFTAPFKITLR